MSNDLLRFDDKVAVITGAGGAIGGAYASLLASRGAKIVVNDVNEEAVAKKLEEIRSAGGVAEGAVFDISTSENCKKIIQVARDNWGEVDILINNAGTPGQAAELEDITDRDHDDMVQVSLHGTSYLTREVWKSMKDRKYGRIVTTASNSVFGMGSSIPYPAAKSAMFGITKNLSVAGYEHNIKVNTVLPAAASTMTLSSVLPDSLKEKLVKEFQPEKVAACVAALVHESTPVSGEAFSVGGGRMSRVFFGQAEGFKDDDVSPEKVMANFDQVLDVSDYRIMYSTIDDLDMHGINFSGF